MKTALIVDDSLFMRSVLRDTLTSEGFTVVGEAETAHEGLRLATEHQPTLITMDVVMPGATGLEALQTLRAAVPKSAILMVTAMGQRVMQDQARGSGADGFLVKPFAPEQLATAITTALAARAGVALPVV